MLITAMSLQLNILDNGGLFFSSLATLHSSAVFSILSASAFSLSASDIDSSPGTLQCCKCFLAATGPVISAGCNMSSALTINEVSEHNTSKFVKYSIPNILALIFDVRSCWVIIRDKVYDVTEFLSVSWRFILTERH